MWLRRHADVDPLDLDSVEFLLRAGFSVEHPSRKLPRAAGWPRKIAGLPPSKWFYLGQGVRSVSVLQAYPEDTGPQSAHRLRFHDESRLSNHVHGLFGHRPTFIRQRLGLEWLLADWMARVS